MELVSMKCPQCYGKVVPVDGGAYGKCLYCDSVYDLGKEAGAVPEEFEEEEQGGGFEEFDPAALIDEWSHSSAAHDCNETYFGSSLPGKREDNARRYFNIDGNEDVYLANDTTIFGSGKKGLACCTTGIYLNDEYNNARYISWEDFAHCDVRAEHGPDRLCIDSDEFITQDWHILYELLSDIQKHL